ncbi:MAG: hypothetical protein LCH73_12270 [Proteobacteria bacterium]|nr:hypothetical protein [Pseudomonadota bacterium]
MKTALDRARLTLVAASLVSGVGIAAAAGPARTAPASLSSLAAQSTFVAHTRVSQVDYVLSTPTPGAPNRLPHALVTFEVMAPLAGAHPGQTITLRFVGGPDGQGRVLSLSDYPVFQVGDEDVLFVAGNGERGCALAKCIDGRFRISGGQMHNGHGVPLTGLTAGAPHAQGRAPAEFLTVTYPGPSFDALMQNPQARQQLATMGLSMAEARAQYVPRPIVMGVSGDEPMVADRVLGEAEAPAPQAAATRVGVQAFAQSVRQHAQALKAAGPFRSADPQAVIATPATRPAVPAQTPAVEAAVSAADAADAAAARQQAARDVAPRR